MIKALIAGFCAFLAFLFVHALIFRVVEPKKRFRALVLIFLSQLPVYMFIYWIIPTPFLVLAPIGAVRPSVSIETVYRATVVLNFLSGLALYAFLFMGYCQFYFIVDRSVSVRAMIEIETSAGRRLNSEGIRERYSLNDMMERRLNQLQEGGYIRKASDSYENTWKGRLVATVFGFLKDFLRLGRGG